MLGSNKTTAIDWLKYFSSAEIENAMTEAAKPIKKLTPAELKKE